MVESRVAKVQINVITSIVQNFVNILISFLSRIIFVRILDESLLGINGLFSNILNILSVADLGMATVMMYSLYKPIGVNDTRKISVIISFFRKVYLAIASAVFLVGIALIPFLKYIVNLEEPVPFLEGYYLLALLNVVISYLFVYRTTLISADQKTYVLNKYTIIFRVITFVAQTFVLFMFKNYFIYLAVAVVISFISNICQNFVALKMYPFLKGNTDKLDKEEKGRIFRDVKAMFLYKICGTIQSNTDNILISIFVGTLFVGYYSNYTLVVTQIITIITLVFNSVKASVGNLIVSNETTDKDKFFLFQVLEMINFWIVGFCSVCFISLFQDFIRICFGEKFVLDIIVVVAVVLNFYTSNIRQSIWTFRETTGIFQETKYVTLVTAILNIVFSLVFGYIWGMTGILLATVLARMLYAWWKEPMVLYGKFFNKSCQSYIFMYIRRAFLCIVVCVMTYFLCRCITVRNHYFSFMLQAAICCVVPNLIFFLCFMHTEEFQYIWKRLVQPVIQKVF